MRYWQDELTQVMGVGYAGEVQVGPDGQPYQWVQGIDGLGNPVGSWRRLRRAAGRVRGFVRQALPVAQRVASMVPHPAAQAVAQGLRAATPVLRRAGVAGHDGLGALYQAPDGSLYQVEGLAQDEELQGLAEDEGPQELAEDEEPQASAEDEELQGLDQGYVREEDMGDVGDVAAYVPEQPPSTRWFTPPAQPPEMWKPMW